MVDIKSIADQPIVSKSRSKTTGFLPTLEKMGKHVSVLLTPEEVCLIQTAIDADGARIMAKADKVCSEQQHLQPTASQQPPHIKQPGYTLCAIHLPHRLQTPRPDCL